MSNQAINTPWKIINNLNSYLVHPYIHLIFFVNRIPWGTRWRFYGIPIVQKHRHSQMHFGNGLQLRSSVRSNPLGPHHPVILCTWQEGASLQVGNNFAMSGGVLCAAQSIHIGNDVAVGANTTIVDTDFHPVDPAERQRDFLAGRHAPIVIEQDVFIGMNCLILKGVRIGAGATIGAGSVVSKDIPPMCVAAGNPAVVIKRLADRQA